MAKMPGRGEGGKIGQATRHECSGRNVAACMEGGAQVANPHSPQVP